jgi:hypothetical protein
MPFQLFKNNALSTLSVAVTSNSQATLTLQTGHGARFPSPLAPAYFMVTLDDGTNIEICKCIARATDALTVLRGMEGTTAQASFATGTKVQLRLTADGLDWVADEANSMTNWLKPVYGVNSWISLGLDLPTLVGSHLSQNLTNSSFLQQQIRNRVTVGNSAQFKVELRSTVPQVSGQAGFRWYARFGVWNLPNSSHFFLGLINTTGTVNSVHPPSSLTQAIVIGHTGSGSPGNLSIWRNDGAGSAVQLDLGSYFTCNTLAAYEFQISVDPGDTNWYYRVKRLDISSIADASSFFSSDVPNNSLWLSSMLHASAMVTSQCAIDLMGWSTEIG